MMGTGDRKAGIKRYLLGLGKVLQQDQNW